MIDESRFEMYRSPTTTVQLLVAYSCELLRSVIGNASHTVPHVLHDDVHTESTSNREQVMFAHCNYTTGNHNRDKIMVQRTN